MKIFNEEEILNFLMDVKTYTTRISLCILSYDAALPFWADLKLPFDNYIHIHKKFQTMAQIVIQTPKEEIGHWDYPRWKVEHRVFKQCQQVLGNDDACLLYSWLLPFVMKKDKREIQFEWELNILSKLYNGQYPAFLFAPAIGEEKAQKMIDLYRKYSDKGRAINDRLFIPNDQLSAHDRYFYIDIYENSNDDGGGLEDLGILSSSKFRQDFWLECLGFLSEEEEAAFVDLCTSLNSDIENISYSDIFCIPARQLLEI